MNSKIVIPSPLNYFKRLGLPIAGIATPLGGPVAVLRISGTGLNALEKILTIPAPGRFCFSKIYSLQKKLIDKGLVLYFKAPESFTGEDVIEIQCHGVRNVVEEILIEITALGIERALPGEFTYRAFMNKKIELNEAEALHEALSMGNLNTDYASKLLGFEEGAASQKTQETLRSLILKIQKARGRIEGAIEYPEAEEEQKVDLESAFAYLSEVEKEASRLLSFYENYSVGVREPLLAIVGKPNVGKSTLFNIFCGAQRALVSPQSGTTRDVIEARLHLPSNHWVRILDTAGIDEKLSDEKRVGSESLETQGMKMGLSHMKRSRLLIWVKHVEDRYTPNKNMEKAFLNMDKPIIEIYSHADKVLSPSEGAFDFRSQGELLLKWIFEKMDKALFTRKAESFEYRISQRQIELIERSLSEIKCAREGLEKERSLELVGEKLKEAEMYLLKAVGENLSPRYIEEIFSQFCLGK